MPQFLVAIRHPDNYDPSLEGEAMVRDIDVLNEEMQAAGARFFADGLESVRYAKTLRKQPDGEVMITDGPYLETKNESRSGCPKEALARSNRRRPQCPESQASVSAGNQKPNTEHHAAPQFDMSVWDKSHSEPAAMFIRRFAFLGDMLCLSNTVVKSRPSFCLEIA
jgi:hypothetical protein